MNIIKTDVLVIGGGGAACRAAIAASDKGCDVLMLVKKSFGTGCATGYSVCEIGGYNLPNGAACREDSPREFYNDIISAGKMMADPRLAEILVNEAVPRFRELEEWGLNIKDSDGEYLVFRGCFSSLARTHVLKGHGESIMRTLISQVRRRPIKVWEDRASVGLLVEQGVCSGSLIFGLDGLTAVSAGAVVLATGGGARLFLRNLNPPGLTGDGYALAWNAGAELVNMEFMQAGVGFVKPFLSIFNSYLWAGYPCLINREGKEFLSGYLPEGLTSRQVMDEHSRHFPFSSGDNSKYIEIGILREIAAGGGTDEGNINASLSHFSKEHIERMTGDSGLSEMWPMFVKVFEKNGFAVTEITADVNCFAHALNGGIAIGPDAMSSIPGLFAAGEVAGGPHGADRLGGNMLLACQVFGKIAGETAAGFSKKHAKRPMTEKTISEQKSAVEGILLACTETDEMERQLGQAANRYLLTYRTQDGLEAILRSITDWNRELLESSRKKQLNLKNLELYHKLVLAKLIAKAALQRRESRGSHYRGDFPYENDKEFGYPHLLKQ